MPFPFIALGVGLATSIAAAAAVRYFDSRTKAATQAVAANLEAGDAATIAALTAQLAAAKTPAQAKHIHLSFANETQAQKNAIIAMGLTATVNSPAAHAYWLSQTAENHAFSPGGQYGNLPALSGVGGIQTINARLASLRKIGNPDF